MNDESQARVVDVDVQLMLQFKSGSLEAFEELFSRYAKPVMNFAYRFVRNREIAEELVQEIFLRVHDAAPGYRPDARFTTWLYRIATNICLNEIRRPRFKAIHESLNTPADCRHDGSARDLEDTSRVGADTLLERRAVSSALRTALAGLPEKQRVAFVLNKYQELSYAEVAEVMKTSEKAVKSLIHRAKEAMAERLRPLMPGLL